MRINLMAKRVKYLTIALAISLAVYGSSGESEAASGEQMSAAAKTDEAGQATFRLAGRDVPLQFVDETTGSPIPGLGVGLALLPESEGVGLMLIVDPFEQYPPRIVILHGEVTGSNNGSQVSAQNMLGLQKGDSSLPAVIIKMIQLQAALIRAVETKALPPLFGNIVNLVGLLGLAKDLTRLMDRAGLPVKEALGDLCEDPEGIKPTDAGREIFSSFVKGNLHHAAVIGISVVATEGLTLPAVVPGAVAGVLIGSTADLVDSVAVMNCDEENLFVTRCGILNLYGCAKSPGNTNPRVLLKVKGKRPDGTPLSKGSIRVISKDKIGEGISGDPNTEMTVPKGPKAVRIVDEGCTSDTIDVKVTKRKTLTLPCKPNPVANVTLSSDPDLTGFLDPCTQVHFRAVATDAAGNVVPCCAEFMVFNPVGSTVATINRCTGQLIVGPDDGAARVLARCGGVTSIPILVSGTGEGEGDCGEEPPSDCGCPQSWGISAFDQTATLTVDNTGNFTGSGWVGTAPGCPDFSIEIMNGHMSGTSMTFEISASFCNGQGTISGSASGTTDAAFPNATSAGGKMTGTIKDPLGPRTFEVQWDAKRETE